MNSWILFQLAVDIILFAIVILYIIRDSRTSQQPGDGEASVPPVDTEQLESLMDELARLVMRAEKVADRIEKGAIPAADKEGRPVKETAQGVPGGGEKEDGKPGREPYERASALIKKGFPDDKISRMVGLPESEISLIRNMAR